MQPVRLTFREVCVFGGSSDESRSLNDLSDDLLARIFAFVVGPLKRQEHYINNGIPVRHEHMEPTMVSNFDDLIVMNLVCKRWNHIVQNRRGGILWRELFGKVVCFSVELWKNIHISAVLLRIPRKKSAWMKVFFWLSRHVAKIECLHLADESAVQDNSLDDVKCGALSLLATHLRVLHLDNCFHRGANADILGVLHLMKNLEQLQISCVNHNFIANVSLLSHLPRLKRLQIQGNGDYWDGHCPVLALSSMTLPMQLQVISLANVRVRGFHEAIDKKSSPLRKSASSLHHCQQKAFHHSMSPAGHISPLVRNWRLSCSRTADMETFAYMSHDFSGFAALMNLKELELCPEADVPEASPYLFDDHIAQLTKLVSLSLTSIGLLEVPPAVTGLLKLKELNLAENKLKTLPSTNVSFASCLTRLILDSNAFTEIPNLMQYSALKELHVSNNPLKFCRDCDYLASLPCLRVLRLGNRRLLDVFPILSTSQVDEICKDLRLGPVGGFHLGSLCSSLRHSNPKCRLLM